MNGENRNKVSRVINAIARNQTINKVCLPRWMRSRNGMTRNDIKNAISQDKSLSIPEKLKLLNSYDQVPKRHQDLFLTTHCEVLGSIKCLKGSGKFRKNGKKIKKRKIIILKKKQPDSNTDESEDQPTQKQLYRSKNEEMRDVQENRNRSWTKSQSSNYLLLPNIHDLLYPTRPKLNHRYRFNAVDPESELSNCITWLNS